MNSRASQLFAEHGGYTFCSWPGISSPEMYSPDSIDSPELDVAQRVYRLSAIRPGTSYTDVKSSPPSCHRREDEKPGSRSSTKPMAGSFHPSTIPDPTTKLLLRFRSLPIELLLKIADDIVREAVGSLYTGCRACRWQDWSHCICRHWQKTFCVLATLDNALGRHVRWRGKDLARSWGYSPVDAFGPYAAGFRFTGKVIGGLRMGDFLFVDEKLTALPEPEPGQEIIATKEVPPEPVYWAPTKGQKLAGIALDVKACPQPPSTIFSRFDCFNMTVPALPSSPVPRLSMPTARNSRSSKRFSLISLKPSAKSVFEIVSTSASKIKRRSFMSASSGTSLIHKQGSHRSSADTDEVPHSPIMYISEKDLYT